MEVTSIAVAGIIAAVLTVLLRQYRPEYAVLLSAGCAALFLGVFLTELIPVFSVMRETAERTGVSLSYVKTLLKCLGISLIGETAGQICKESGQLSLVFYMEVSSRLLILLMTLPLFGDLVEIVLTLLD